MNRKIIQKRVTKFYNALNYNSLEKKGKTIVSKLTMPR